jgi:predicted ester cyclase
MSAENPSLEDNRGVILASFDALKNNDFDAFEANHTPDFVDHDPGPGEVPTPEGRKEFQRMIRGVFPDWTQRVEECVAEGDRVVIRWVGEGTHRGTEFMGVEPSGKPVRVQGIAMFRVSDGKMAERWAVVDQFGLASQIGAIKGPPGPALLAVLKTLRAGTNGVRRARRAARRRLVSGRTRP